MQSIVETWRKNTGNDDTGRRAHQQPMELHDAPPADYGSSGIRAPKDSLWRGVVRHFRALDRRPPTHVPFFNGNLFKPHDSEKLIIGDEWLAGFISELSADESPYLFDAIPVEILGSVYERFLGKVVRPAGRGITIEDKPEVRKAGGVYYTPRYIVDYIVEQTAGKLLDEIAVGDDVRSLKSKTESQSLVTSTPTLKDFEKRTAALRLLDPACGSGSFLIRAFERVCEHWQKRLTADLRGAFGVRGHDGALELADMSARGTAETCPRTPEQKAVRAAWEKKHRPLCWIDPESNDVHLTVALKRQILTQNIYGVDLDAAAVEVTQLSLYLKMLEHENRTTLQRQRELLADETDIALLPPLQDNIKCGNSLIASDFSMMPEDLVRVHAFDWPVQFAPILKAGGFDAVIGNPPYVRPHNLEPEAKEYFWRHYDAFEKKGDLYCCFSQKAASLCRNGGRFSFIVSNGWLRLDSFQTLRKMFLDQTAVEAIVDLPDKVFAEAQVKTCIFVSVFAGTYDDGRYYVKDVLIVIPFKEKPAPKIALKAVLAMLNSRLLTFYYRTTFQTIHVQRNELASLPLAQIDFSKPADKARHDKLVALVDKLLGLMPKLRLATADSEKAVLQNAVTATDQQIDALVYELYGLTDDEIKLVEGGQ